jgi:hypothetical protein
MPRELSATIKAVIDAQYGVETHEIVNITLPAVGILPSITLYCAGRTGLVVGGQVYQNTLRAIGGIKQSLGGNSDASSITLENVSQTLGVTLTDLDRTLDGADVVIKRAFLVDPDANTYETDELMRGVVDGVKIDEETVTLTVISDISKRTARVGNVQITQRCRHVFNVSGSGIGPSCNWQVAQGGDPLDCDLVFDSPNGCAGHNNQFHFGGVPTLKAKEIPPQSYPPGIGEGGWPTVPTRYGELDPDRRISELDIGSRRMPMTETNMV